MIQDSAIVAMEGEYKLVCDLSNGTISNDLERTLTMFSRSHHSLALNISQMATDTAIVNRWRIGNCTQDFELHQFQWSWVTFNQHVKDILFNVTNSQTVQYRSIGPSYNGRVGLIESHTWSVEPRHFQWPWMTPNPDFKVRPLLHAEYL